MGSIKGEYLPSKNLITLSDKLNDLEMRSTLLHEVQHGVDKLEGRSSGSNMYRGQRVADELYQPKQKMAQHAVAQLAKRDYEAGMPIDEAIEKAIVQLSQEKKLPLNMPLHWDMISSLARNKPADQLVEDANYWNKQLARLEKQNITGDAWTNYLRNAGEQRARLVQSRRHMSPIDREMKYPYDTATVNNVPFNEVIPRIR